MVSPLPTNLISGDTLWLTEIWLKFSSFAICSILFSWSGFIYECIKAIATLFIPSDFALISELRTSFSFNLVTTSPFSFNLSDTSTTLSYNNSGNLIFKSNNSGLFW